MKEMLQMIKMDLYKKAMEIGCLFNKKYSDDCRTEDWNASEEASYFCKKIIKKAEKHKCSVRESFEKYGDKASKNYYAEDYVKRSSYITFSDNEIYLPVGEKGKVEVTDFFIDKNE